MRAHNYAELGGADVLLLYAEGWLLVRYIFDHPDRQRQINEYLRPDQHRHAVRSGGAGRRIPELAAFNSQLFDYAGQGHFNVVRLPFRTIDVGPITRPDAPPAEQALILDEIKLSQGYAQREASDFRQPCPRRGLAFPRRSVRDPDGDGRQYLAGNNDAATAAADRLLAIEPHNARALATKGLIQSRRPGGGAQQ